MKNFFFSFLLVCSVLFGQTAHVNTSIDNTKYDKELVRIQKWVRQYQHKFGMDGIDIGVSVVSLKDLQPNTCGDSLWILKFGFHYGIIHVLRFEDYNLPGKPCHFANPRKDQENTVVHEFGHFVLKYAEDEEMAVSVFSNIIVPEKPIKEKPKKELPKKKPIPSDLIFNDYQNQHYQNFQ